MPGKVWGKIVYPFSNSVTPLKFENVYIINAYDYLSMLELKLIRLGKRGPMCLKLSFINPYVPNLDKT